MQSSHIKHNIAKIAPLSVPYSADILYSYLIPDELAPSVYEGVFCVVPFGGGNRKMTGIVYETVYDDSEYISKYKPIFSVLSDTVSLSSEFLKLCSFIKEHTFCTMGDAIRAAVPAAALSRVSECYIIKRGLTCEESDKLSPKLLLVYSYIEDMRQASADEVRQNFGNHASETLNSLLEIGAIERTVNITGGTNIVMKKHYTVSPAADTVKLRSAKMREITERIRSAGRLSQEELLMLFPACSAQLSSLVKKGVLLLETTDAFRDPLGARIKNTPCENNLNDEQKAAYEKLLSLYKTGKANAALLHGVTGSGKTRVILALCDDVIKDGRGVILLIPEISLTTQTADIFRSHYGDMAVILHSNLSDGERFDAWRRIKSGDALICIGTRSAVFAPFERLGLIVIDEEQEHTYKSDINPKYHARDIARFRCAANGAMMLLASATPSVESYYKAKQGIYTLVELNSRYGNASLPKTVIADLRRDIQSGNLSPVGNALGTSLSSCLAQGEQAILFINRRGYNNFISCPTCGSVIMCPHCSVSLTAHRTERGRNDYLTCHYCGYTAEIPEKCPSCGGEHLKPMGYGTQKAEEYIAEKFAAYKIIRMDADTTSSKGAYGKILDSFRLGRADILLGTQMVTKGHDFPGVTLVGVLFADASLYLEDYRANERTFSLITQVIGRAGRASKPGCAVIQTLNPEHPTIKLAAKQDYRTFFANEIAFRKTFLYPPFCDLILITFTGTDEAATGNIANGFVSFMKLKISDASDRRYAKLKFIIFGPFEAAIYKVNENFRKRILIKCSNVPALRALICENLKHLEAQAGRKVKISVDVDPNNI